MNATELYYAVERLTEARLLSREEVKKAIEEALKTVFKKVTGKEVEVTVTIDDIRKVATITVPKTVVGDPSNPITEISLEEARRIKPDVQIGDTVEAEATLSSLSLSAIRTAKQIILQRLKEAERENIYQEFKQKVGQLVTAEIKRIDRGAIYLYIDRIELILPKREQVPTENYAIGKRMKVLVVSVERTSKDPKIVVSRRHPNLLRRLFEIEVPEIRENIVEIMAIAREPGIRSKTAVRSNDPHVDPIGACIGLDGSRINSIRAELQGEKVEVIKWAEDVVQLVANALSPAKALWAYYNQNENRVHVIVPDGQLSVAIGKGGINAKLAAKLAKVKVDIWPISKSNELFEKLKEQGIEVETDIL